MSYNLLKFKLFHNIKNPKLINTFNKLKNNNTKTLSDLEDEQFRDLRKMILFVYKNVPYYREFMYENDIKPNDIKKIEDLNVFPVINKKIINDNYQRFIPEISIKYIDSSTGGTTGEPLKYRMSIEDNYLGKSTLWWGFTLAGYKLGDRIMTIAGGSLVPDKKNYIKDFILRSFTNNYTFSSYTLNESMIIKILHNYEKIKPKFLRGYASSLNLISDYILKHDIKLVHRPTAIFSTAENLTADYREAIEDAFHTDVFDQYGLNDGGISAFECKLHQGYHVPTKRSLLQVVDSNNEIANPGELGRIIATNLNNYAMPLIRYETGDLGVVSKIKCECNVPYSMLSKIGGRTDDFIVTKSGDKIHSGFLRVIMKNSKIIEQFQVVQDTLNSLQMYLVLKSHDNVKTEIDKIINQIEYRIPELTITIKICNTINKTKSGKQRFFISKIDK